VSAAADRLEECQIALLLRVDEQANGGRMTDILQSPNDEERANADPTDIAEPATRPLDCSERFCSLARPGPRSPPWRTRRRVCDLGPGSVQGVGRAPTTAAGSKSAPFFWAVVSRPQKRTQSVAPASFRPSFPATGPSPSNTISPSGRCLSGPTLRIARPRGLEGVGGEPRSPRRLGSPSTGPRCGRFSASNRGITTGA
jgi:hypothetical protein